MPPDIRPLTAYACLGLSMLIVGSNIGIGKMILQDLPVFLFAALRFLIASVVLAAGMALVLASLAVGTRRSHQPARPGRAASR